MVFGIFPILVGYYPLLLTRSDDDFKAGHHHNTLDTGGPDMLGKVKLGC